jgi:thioredoxin 1
MIAPILEELAEEYEGRIKIAKLDADANTAAYGIVSIPTLNVYKNGEVVTSLVGARPKRAKRTCRSRELTDRPGSLVGGIGRL